MEAWIIYNKTQRYTKNEISNIQFHTVWMYLYGELNGKARENLHS